MLSYNIVTCGKTRSSSAVKTAEGSLKSGTLLCKTPPGWPVTSIKVTSTPFSMNALAATSPVTPAPTIATDFLLFTAFFICGKKLSPMNRSRDLIFTPFGQAIWHLAMHNLPVIQGNGLSSYIKSAAFSNCPAFMERTNKGILTLTAQPELHSSLQPPHFWASLSASCSVSGVRMCLAMISSQLIRWAFTSGPSTQGSLVSPPRETRHWVHNPGPSVTRPNKEQ